jgi:hypothetical protein
MQCAISRMLCVPRFRPQGPSAPSSVTFALIG